MILKIRCADDWVMIDNVEEIQYADKESRRDPSKVIKSERDLEQMRKWENAKLLFSYCEDSFPFRVGIMMYSKAGETGDLKNTIVWRGQLYVMSDKGKTVEAIHVGF